MSSSIEATGQLADGHDNLGPVWIDEVAYKPGQEVPVQDPVSETGSELAGGYPGIETIRGAEQRFRSLGHGPTRSELDV